MAHTVAVEKSMLNLIVVSLRGMSFLSGFFIFGILQFHFDVFEISFTCLGFTLLPESEGSCC